MIPLLSVRGPAYERGRQYGEGARDRIAGTLDMYRRVFEAVAGLDWQAAVGRGLSYEACIGELQPSYLDEIRGMAAGAGVAYGEIMAVNVRTEIIFSAIAAAERGALDGCSAFALAGSAATTGHVTIGQNWDWLPEASDNLIVLEALRDDAPSYVTVVEAGLLAKAGMSSAGVGVVTNALVTAADKGGRGVPYHVLLRAILDCSDAEAAASLVAGATRSSSANFLVADAGGRIVDVEGGAGSADAVGRFSAHEGRACHTNHFIARGVTVDDVMVTHSPDTTLRLARLTELIGGVTPLRRQTLESALRDHRNRPGSVCQHADPSRPRYEQAKTLVSVIFDLEERSMWLAEGSPCESGFEPVPIFAGRSRR